MSACRFNVRYGYSCEKSCAARHCAVQTSSCNGLTGACGTGCQAGWTGVDCNTGNFSISLHKKKTQKKKHKQINKQQQQKQQQTNTNH